MLSKEPRKSKKSGEKNGLRKKGKQLGAAQWSEPPVPLMKGRRKNGRNVRER